LAPLLTSAVQGFLISLFRLAPAKLISGISLPILILQGERDLQIDVDDALRLKDAQPNAELTLLPDTNHVLKRVASADPVINLATYADPTLPLAPGIVEAISNFILVNAMDDVLSAFWRSAGMVGPVGEPTVFGDTAEQQNALCALILCGQKRATTSLARWYDPASKPKPGERRIFVDGSGVPRGIIETTKVEQTRFRAVTPEFARTEGEGDGSLAYWLAEHERYFRNEQRKEDLEFTEDELLILEYFKLIWPTAYP
jgi:uncharacterized protein YhfF